MSKTTDNILRIHEQTGTNLVRQQKEVDFYGESYTPEEIERQLNGDPGYSEFLDSLEDKNRPF